MDDSKNTLDLEFPPDDIVTLDLSSMYTTTGNTVTSPQYGNITFSNSTNPYIYQTTGIQSSLTVSGDAEFDGDVKIKGVSIAKALEDIQKRLAILVPDPEKLEHFEALKKAYEHYKVLEALCQLPAKEEK
jgi:predicted acyltransferase (DUF342 family)